MQDNEKKPALRFKGFTDPWEQRKLGDISEIKTGPFGSTLHADDYVSDGIPIITTEHFKTGSLPIDKCGLPQVSENDFSRLSAYILNAGDIVFSRVGSVDINALITPFQSTWLFSGRVLRVRPQNKNSSQFLHTLLETEDVKNDIRTRAVGQTMPSINTEILKTTPLRLPESTLEQEQLGKYFLNLDTLITLHQRKYEKLVNIKKSMLDKMFPKNGASVPEIRFKGFTDPWEQRKFSDITFPAGEKNRDNLPLESYSITNEHGFIPQDEKFENGGTMREADKRMYYIVSPNSFAYNPARINVGSIGYQNTGKDVIVSSLYEVFKTSDDVDDRLLWHWFKSPDFQKLIFQLQEGGVRLYFYYDKLCMGTVSLPSLEEQRKIGQFFDSLDTLITLHQREHIKPILEVKRVKRNE